LLQQSRAPRLTLNKSKLPKLFWGEALSTVSKVLNMLPSASLDHNTTPFELIEKCKPDYSILCVFGCRGHVHIDRKACKSLDSHVIPCLFLGYPADYRGWRLWDPVGKRVITAGDMIWDESTMPGNSSAPVAPLRLLDFTVTPDTEGVKIYGSGTLCTHNWSGNC
jgi:hypothetical protein